MGYVENDTNRARRIAQNGIRRIMGLPEEPDPSTYPGAPPPNPDYGPHPNPTEPTVPAEAAVQTDTKWLTIGIAASVIAVLYVALKK